MRCFFELMIPELDDITYLRFASINNLCAKLLNDVQSKSCFVPLSDEKQNYNIILLYPSYITSLLCCDGNSLKVTEDLVCFSGLIKNIHIDNSNGYTMDIELKSITSKILQGIIEFCSEHGSVDLSEAYLEKFDSEFVQQYELLNLAQAYETLKIHCLLDLVAPMIVRRINHKQALKGWWGNHEDLATRRVKTRRSVRDIIPWEDVKLESHGGVGLEPPFREARDKQK
ncbi:unnamed protein product [Arabis nemorensis]|uniref:SKP1 component POZ domain-containing protein n=1 Tax=Arabis nemorensis TaxID=586526 RepID=A0A565CG00_9BRAS|nr:unnamed protein product [Arabis nemorensis]